MSDRVSTHADDGPEQNKPHSRRRAGDKPQRLRSERPGIDRPRLRSRSRDFDDDYEMPLEDLDDLDELLDVEDADDLEEEFDDFDDFDPDDDR